MTKTTENIELCWYCEDGHWPSSLCFECRSTVGNKVELQPSLEIRRIRDVYIREALEKKIDELTQELEEADEACEKHAYLAAHMISRVMELNNAR